MINTKYTNDSLISKHIMGKIASKLAEKNDSEHLTNPVNNFSELQCRDLKGQPFSFQSLKEKKLIMVVNVASECGLTKDNYSHMAPSYDKWSSKGLEIIAFPCNQFGKQEPGTPE